MKDENGDLLADSHNIVEYVEQILLSAIERYIGSVMSGR
jgi:hypothetical protein